jgi:hypothetical protein
MRHAERSRGGGSRWAIQRERCRLGPDDREPDSDGGIPVSTVVAALMKRVRVEDEQWITSLTAEWPALVGEAVSRHTRPGRFDRGELRVFVDSAVWLSELKRWGGESVLSNLSRRFGPSRIQTVRFEMDPDGGAGWGSA